MTISTFYPKSKAKLEYIFFKKPPDSHIIPSQLSPWFQILPEEDRSGMNASDSHHDHYQKVNMSKKWMRTFTDKKWNNQNVHITWSLRASLPMDCLSTHPSVFPVSQLICLSVFPCLTHTHTHKWTGPELQSNLMHMTWTRDIFNKITFHEHFLWTPTSKTDTAALTHTQAEAELLHIKTNISTFLSNRERTLRVCVPLLLLGHLSYLKLGPALHKRPTISDFSQQLWRWGNNRTHIHTDSRAHLGASPSVCWLSRGRCGVNRPRAHTIRSRGADPRRELRTCPSTLAQ